MQLIIYLLFYPILLGISKLPFRVLYFLSDCVYVFVYYVLGYRKKIVRVNIVNALPHLSEKERLIIEKKSFKHFCDIIIEMIKTISITQKEIDERYVFTNIEVYKDLEKKGKSIALMCAHYASYEWAVSLNRFIGHKGYGIYKKLNNPYFDKLVHHIRSKFKATLITTKQTIPTIEENHKNNVLGVFGFASDQSPMIHNTHYWNTFMGIVVPIHTGAEMLAKKYDMNVIFMRTKKIKRGYYEASFELLFDNPREVPDYQITDKFIKLVEQQILEAPEYYLWTHKRWKHRK
jgi:Kdo2-lipid IVA lauroyltransferase/acyltransferase